MRYFFDIRPKGNLEFSVIKRDVTYEKDPLTLSCNATNGNWKFCRWAKGEDISCTFSYEFIPSSGDWTVRNAKATIPRIVENAIETSKLLH